MCVFSMSALGILLSGLIFCPFTFCLNYAVIVTAMIRNDVCVCVCVCELNQSLKLYILLLGLPEQKDKLLSKETLQHLTRRHKYQMILWLFNCLVLLFTHY